MRKILTLSLIFLCACNRVENNKFNSIDVLSDPDGEIRYLSEIATSVEYIPLQATENSIVGGISSLKAKRNYLYVSTSDKIFCFDISGKFLFKLAKNGRGPEEYVFIDDFDINSDNTLMAVLSGSRIVLFKQSSTGFTFLRKITLSTSPSRINFTKKSNNLLLQYSNQDGTKPFSKELIKICGESLLTWSNYMKFSLKDGWVTTSFFENLSYYLDNNLFLKELQNDTLFFLSGDNKMEPFLIFNTQDKRLTPEARSNGKYYNDHSREYFIIQKIFSSDKFVYYTFSYNKYKQSYKILFDRESNKKFSVPKKENLKDDLIGGVNFEPKYCNDGYFYSWIEAVYLKNYISGEAFRNSNVKFPLKKIALMNLGESLSEYDNPILIVAKIR